MILYVNGCVRAESRTDRLARALLAELGGEYTEVKLAAELPEPLTAERLSLRTALIERGEYDHPMFRYARQLAEAETVVVSAPFWDMGFPAILKNWLEQVYITGLTSRYDEKGQPVGLCHGGKLWYVSTAGGPFFPQFSYDYLRALAVTCFGIRETELLCAEGLDIWGNDAEAILRSAMETIPALVRGGSPEGERK